MDIQIPCNTVATVTLQPPTHSTIFSNTEKKNYIITEAGILIHQIDIIQPTSTNGVYNVPSGNYHFCISTV